MDTILPNRSECVLVERKFSNTLQNSVPNTSNWKLFGRRIIRINDIRVLRVHAPYISKYFKMCSCENTDMVIAIKLSWK